MGDFLEYPDLLQEVRGAMHPGRLKLQSNNIIFKNIKTGKVDQFPSTEVEKAQWLVRARGNCLKMVLQGGTIHRFDGFKESDYDKLSAFLKKNYEASLEKVDLSIKGWNFGLANFVGGTLDFQVSGKTAFEIPLANVSHTTNAKNEVTIEFHQNDDAPVSLTECRFHIPFTADADAENDPVSDFHKNVLAKADVIQVSGESIATFSEIQCLTPRGRYDIKIYPTFLQLHGKTFDYKIPYTTVLRLFLLPHRDNRQMFLVMSLDPPIKQGQTRYHFLILLFNKEDETTLEISLSEEDIQERYNGKLNKEMSGLEYEVVSRIMKAVCNRKITVPGTFLGNSGMHSIACSYKAATGSLYPLERGFIFIHKPPIHVRFDEVSHVNFARSTANTRSFDFEVETKAGAVHTFVGVEKDEYGKLYDFVTQKKLRVKNIGSNITKGKSKSATNDDMYDSDENDEHDAYLERMKAEGQDRETGDEDDESDTDDDDFVAPENSGSEVAEEYDTDATSSSSDDEDEEGGDPEEKKKKKEKKKKEKERTKTKTIREPSQRKRKKSGKEKKDPNMPKRPLSAYFFWLNENRETIKEENPGISITDITRIGGEKWRELKDRSKWETKAAEAKEEYTAAMEEYKKNLAESGETSGKSKKSSKSGDSSSSPKKSHSKSVSKSPSKAGSGTHFKSKEFISSSDSSGDEDKPLKKKRKEKPEKKKKAEKEEEEEDEFAGLPEDEEILSSPSESGDEGSGSGLGSGGGSEESDAGSD